jgi:hypothetical protein
MEARGRKADSTNCTVLYTPSVQIGVLVNCIESQIDCLLLTEESSSTVKHMQQHF